MINIIINKSQYGKNLEAKIIFHLRRNKIEYFSLDLNYAKLGLLNTINPDANAFRMDKKILHREGKDAKKKVEESGLDEDVFIQNSCCCVYLKRTHFLKFQNFCLSMVAS